MSTEYVADGAGVPVGPGLSQVERVVDTFIAPSKTFTDIRRNASWWLPVLLMIVFSFLGMHEVDKKIGFDRVAENQIHSSAKAEDRFNSAEPAQRAQMMKIQTTSMKFGSYGFPVILLITQAIYALLLWAAFNFGLGGETKYSQVLAVCWYAALPYIFTSLLIFLTVHFGNNTDGFDIKNMVGTNPAYYMPDASPILKAILSSLDVIRLWSVVLTVIGMAIIAKKTIAQSATVVGIFWVLGVLLGVVGALFS